MSDQATSTGVDHSAHCENCAAALHGEFCHACGQSVHNPIRHFGHAIEEFFEAFWHLDGRVFRTLRDLWFPGRVAINYLAGHRARYIAPLRLFVILSVLTFFIGAVSVHVDDNPVTVTGIEEIRGAGTVEEVERIRDAMTAEIEAARVEAGNTPGIDPALVAAEVRIHGAAANRIVELTGEPAAGDTGESSAPGGKRPSSLQFNSFGHKGVWDAETNPLVVNWWPRFANDWLNRKVGNLDKNMQSFDGAAPDVWLQGIMSSAPSALFLLVPVFALLLKVAYLFTRRVYLEHLVVALYSHIFLLLMLTAAFLLAALDDWVGTRAAGVVSALAMFAILVWMPVYLLMMQKRVYAQSWWLTVPKYLVIGFIYFMMLTFATLLVFLGRLTAA
ncbi:DUF3667 domain-containing protein [Luteimonas sp. A534]